MLHKKRWIDWLKIPCCFFTLLRKQKKTESLFFLCQHTKKLLTAKISKTNNTWNDNRHPELHSLKTYGCLFSFLFLCHLSFLWHILTTYDSKQHVVDPKVKMTQLQAFRNMFTCHKRFVNAINQNNNIIMILFERQYLSYMF